jgi:hypothetical protein
MTERAAYGSDVKYQREAIERPFMGRLYTGRPYRGQRKTRNDWPMMTFMGRIHGGNAMSDIVYLIGLIVIVMAILSFIGLR